MKKLKIEINVSQDQKVAKYLQLMNGVMQLTPTQLKVLQLLIQANPKVCTPEARKFVTREMGFKGVSVTNNFIRVLRDKEIIIKHQKTFVYSPTIAGINELKGIEFVFAHE